MKLGQSAHFIEAVGDRWTQKYLYSYMMAVGQLSGIIEVFTLGVPSQHLWAVTVEVIPG
jgi:hypothetical protein